MKQNASAFCNRLPILILSGTLALATSILTIPAGAQVPAGIPTSAAIQANPTPLPERVEQVALVAPSGNKNQEVSKPYLMELLKLRDKDGRDNALIHYTVAGWALPGDAVTQQEIDKLIAPTLHGGWTAQSAPLLPVLGKYQVAFAETRKGAALDYAQRFKLDMKTKEISLNYRPLQMISRMLCVEGRYFESQGQYAKALDNYLTVLTLGRDLSGPDQVLIGNFISIGVQHIALTPLSDLVTSGHLARPDLEKAAARLKQIQQTTVSLCGIIEGESACERLGIQDAAEKIKQGLEAAKKEGKNPDIALKEIVGNMLGIDVNKIPEPLFQLIGKDLDKATDKYDQLVKLNLELAGTPFAKRDLNREQQTLQNAFMELHPLAQKIQSNYQEVSLRHIYRQTKMLGVQVQVALELSKLDKGKYPTQLSELAPTYLEAAPIDPFGGKGFVYSATIDQKGYTFSSIGPDKTLGPGSVSYDVTNGATSAGDVLFGKR